MCNELEYDIDFQPICLEDPTRHRLTHKDASIDAVPLRGGAHIHSNENPAGIIGYWHTNITKREKPVPLYTRYQPRGCRQPEDLISARCEEATDVSRFDPYEFQFATDIRLQNRLEKKEDTVCFIGASHALHLTVRAQKILKERNIVSVTAKTMEGIQFAREYTEEEIQWINDQHCTKVIIGIGQWDASYWADMEYEGNAPTLFQEYEDDLKKAMAIMVDIFRDNNVDLYFRTTHYNPMGDFITACPPLDWRSPLVIDMYNDILRRLCKSFKIPLIDTNDIIGIMWDRAEDWCHFRDVSGDMETIYILDRIFA